MIQSLLKMTISKAGGNIVSLEMYLTKINLSAARSSSIGLIRTWENTMTKEKEDKDHIYKKRNKP